MRFKIENELQKGQTYDLMSVGNTVERIILTFSHQHMGRAREIDRNLYRLTPQYNCRPLSSQIKFFFHNQPSKI